MKSSFLLTLGAAGLLLASCSEYKKTEEGTTGAAADGTAVTTTTTTTTTTTDTIALRDDARRLAARVADDLQLTDQPTRRRLENAYYVRRQRLAELDTRYAADTVGRYAALRDVNDETDREIRQLLPNPVMVRTYESGRFGYFDGPYTATTTAGSASSGARPAATRRGPRIVKYEKDGRETKIEYSNGTTVKIDKDGDRKVKYANGVKVKTDGDDGERKVKD